MASDPVFFELSWSILSVIGAANVFFGLLVISVTNFSPIAAVPLITSTACAVANGLCYYAFYLTYPPAVNRAVASAFADMLWLVQEAGLSFYGYVILSRILCNTRKRYVFMGLFWVLMVAIVVVRIMIADTRVRYIIGGDSNDSLQHTVNHLHVAYFLLIAVVECVSAYYLLTTFAKAKKNSLKRAMKTGLFQYLMRSTEVRLALLAMVGTMRAVTYSFQVSAQSATSLSGQIDRFCYTMECLFPMILYIDMLACKVVHTNQSYNLSCPSWQRRRSSNNTRHFTTNGDDDVAFPALTYSSTRAKRGVEVHTGRANSAYGGSCSEERIIHGESSGMAPSDVDLDAMELRQVGISKTVKLEVEASEPRFETGSPSL